MNTVIICYNYTDIYIKNTIPVLKLAKTCMTPIYGVFFFLVIYFRVVFFGTPIKHLLTSFNLLKTDDLRMRSDSFFVISATNRLFQSKKMQVRPLFLIRPLSFIASSLIYNTNSNHSDQPE